MRYPPALARTADRGVDPRAQGRRAPPTDAAITRARRRPPSVRDCPTPPYAALTADSDRMILTLSDTSRFPLPSAWLKAIP
jgi:hypothetical protein